MPTGGKVVALIVAKVACCAVLLLALTGATGGVIAWLFESPLIWTIAAGLVLGIGVTVWRRSSLSRHFSHWSRPGSRRGDAIRQEKAEERSRATLEAIDATGDATSDVMGGRQDATLRAVLSRRP